jgi:hypothetical protein
MHIYYYIKYIYAVNSYTKIRNEQTGWIALLATDSIGAVDEVIKDDKM